MFLLYFKLVLRDILRNKTHTLINVLGFSIGMVTTMFLFLFLKYEMGYDKFYKDADRLYRIETSLISKGEVTKSGFCWYPMAQDVKNEIPGINDFCRIANIQKIKCYIQNQLYTIDLSRYVDENFFSFFDFRLVEGDSKNALGNSESVVISQKQAAKIFGNKSAIGQKIIYNQKPYTISGIAADIPSDTHLQFDLLFSTKYLEENKKNFGLGYCNGLQLLSYLKLSEGISVKQIEARFPDLLYQKFNKENENVGFKLTASLQNIKDVHLSSGNVYDCDSNRKKNYLNIVAGICLVILILAVVNYIILFIAQKAGKTRELSLMKIHGADNIMLSFLTFLEVTIISLSASILGIWLLYLILPILNDHLQTSVAISGNILPILLFQFFFILILSFLITVISNRFILNIKTLDAIKVPNCSYNYQYGLGGVLVAFQFTVVILMLVSVFFLARQNSFVLNKELGFNKNDLLLVASDFDFKNNELFEFKQQLKAIPSICSVCIASQSVGNGLTKNSYILNNEGESRMINTLYTDADFLECFEIPLISGRNFCEDITKEKHSIIVNQKLIERAKWRDPLSQFISRDSQLKVIGVAGDFNFDQLSQDIQPLIISVNPAGDNWGYNCIYVRYEASDIGPLTGKIRNLWESNFPSIPYEINSLNDQLKSNYTSLRTQAKIAAFFSGLSILLACMGLFGLTIFAAKNRTKEIGIRKVNGAKVSEILALINKDVIKWMLIAFAIATPVAWYVMNKWLGDFAYKTGLSWWIFVLAGLLALGIALLTVSWQSWKAATKNPVEALRNE